MNKSRQGTQLQPLMMDLLQRYLSRPDLPVAVRVERLHDGALLVTHTTGVCVRISVVPCVTAEQAAALR